MRLVFLFLYLVSSASLFAQVFDADAVDHLGCHSSFAINVKKMNTDGIDVASANKRVDAISPQLDVKAILTELEKNMSPDEFNQLLVLLKESPEALNGFLGLSQLMGTTTKPAVRATASDYALAGESKEPIPVLVDYLLDPTKPDSKRIQNFLERFGKINTLASHGLKAPGVLRLELTNSDKIIDGSALPATNQISIPHAYTMEVNRGEGNGEIFDKIFAHELGHIYYGVNMFERFAGRIWPVEIYFKELFEIQKKIDTRLLMAQKIESDEFIVKLSEENKVQISESSETLTTSSPDAKEFAMSTLKNSLAKLRKEYNEAIESVNMESLQKTYIKRSSSLQEVFSDLFAVMHSGDAKAMTFLSGYDGLVRDFTFPYYKQLQAQDLKFEELRVLDPHVESHLRYVIYDVFYQSKNKNIGDDLVYDAEVIQKVFEAYVSPQVMKVILKNSDTPAPMAAAAFLTLKYKENETEFTDERLHWHMASELSDNVELFALILHMNPDLAVKLVELGTVVDSEKLLEHLKTLSVDTGESLRTLEKIKDVQSREVVVQLDLSQLPTNLKNLHQDHKTAESSGSTSNTSASKTITVRSNKRTKYVEREMEL